MTKSIEDRYCFYWLAILGYARQAGELKIVAES